MANFNAIAAVGKSLQRFLTYGFEKEPPVPSASGRNTTKVTLIRTEDMEKNNAGGGISKPSLTIFLYRIDFNKTMRAAWSALGSQDGRAHLPLDLYFLITAWAGDAETEYRILGRAMQCLESSPILSGPFLDPMGNWATHEAVQICLAETTMEEIMRIFDSLPLDYKLSVPYLTRAIRVEAPDQRIARPVTTLETGVKSGMQP